MPLDRPTIPSPSTSWLPLIPIVLGLGLLGLGGLVLAWDGSWFVLRTHLIGEPTFLHGRLGAIVPQLPALLVARLGGDPAWATAATGLGYAAIPALALLATWRVTRPDRDDLLAFAALGIGLLALPGRAILISEAVWTVDLTWPLVIAAALGRIRRHRLLLAAIALLAILAHPFGVVVMALTATAAAARAWRRPEPGDRRLVAVLGVVTIAAVLWAVGRAALLSPEYESAALGLARFAAHARGSVGPAPLIAVAASFIVGIGLALRTGARLPWVLVAVGLGVALVALATWAGDPVQWQRALMFRTVALLVQIPLLVLAAGLAMSPAREGHRLPAAVTAAVGIVLIVTVTVQTSAWHGLVGRLDDALGSRPPGCVPGAELPLAGTALDHWGVTALVLVHHAPTPRHLVVLGDDCALVTPTEGLPVKVIDGRVVDRAPVAGRLDLSAIERALDSR